MATIKSITVNNTTYDLEDGASIKQIARGTDRYSPNASGVVFLAFLHPILILR